MRLIARRTQKLGQKSPKAAKSTILRQPKIGKTTNRVISRKPFPIVPIVRIIVISGMVAFSVWLFNSPLFLVRNVEVEGLKNADKNAVLQHVPEHANIWLLSRSNVAKNIRQSSPYIADVVVLRGIPDTIRIKIAERVLAVEWVSSDKHYIVGLDGTVIAEGTPHEPIPKVVDVANVPATVGHTVATPGLIHFIGEVYGNYQNKIGSEIDHLEVGETTFEIAVMPKTGSKMVLDTTRSADNQLTAGKLVLDQKASDIKEYLDLRVPGKAYYR